MLKDDIRKINIDWGQKIKEKKKKNIIKINSVLWGGAQ
jgi:hypothetical protein